MCVCACMCLFVHLEREREREIREKDLRYTMFSFFCFIFYFILLLSYILFFYFLVPQAAKEAKVPPRCSRPNRTPPPPPPQQASSHHSQQIYETHRVGQLCAEFGAVSDSANVDRRVRADVRRPRTRLHGNHSSTSNYHKLVFVSLFCATAYCFYIEQRMGLGRFVWSMAVSDLADVDRRALIFVLEQGFMEIIRRHSRSLMKIVFVSLFRAYSLSSAPLE